MNKTFPQMQEENKHTQVWAQKRPNIIHTKFRSETLGNK
jgi:hypothetical protein